MLSTKGSSGKLTMVSSWMCFYLLANVPTTVHGGRGLRNAVHNVTPGVKYNIDSDLDLHIFCRNADAKTLLNYFRTATLRITSAAEDIQLLRGHSEVDVYNQHVQSAKILLWVANLLPWRARDANFPTFNASCVGISTSKPYKAELITKPIDAWNLVTLIAGLALFFLAPNLSESTLFFYGGGTFVGAIAVLLVVLFFTFKMIPRFKGSNLFASVLWPLCIYWTVNFWYNIVEYLHNQLPYVLISVTVGALCAFTVCYRFGPPQNPKTLDIIRWMLQIGGLVLVHFSSDLYEVSTTIIVLTLLYHNFSGKMFYELQKQWKRRFPPKMKYLTEEEYISQGATETNKALHELRQYCSSPECNSWKLVTRLKNAKRFSEFVEGSSHLSDNEMMSFETEIMKTDDEDDEEGEVETLPVTDDEDDPATIAPISASSPLKLQNSILSNGNGNGRELLTDEDSD